MVNFRMANWQRGDLYLKGTKNALAGFIHAAMTSDVSIHGLSLPAVNGGYIDSEIKIDFNESAKLSDDKYIFNTYLSNCGSIDAEDFIGLSKTFNVDVYVDAADPWGGIQHTLLIENGIVSKNEVKEFERE